VVTGRVAVLGGDGRHAARCPVGWTVYASSGFAGHGQRRRLVAAIKAGAFDVVIVLARWNGHSDIEAVRRACRAAGVPVRVTWTALPADGGERGGAWRPSGRGHRQANGFPLLHA
jgi:hypothetical protein